MCSGFETVSLAIPGWPQTPAPSVTSVTQVLGLKATPPYLATSSFSAKCVHNVNDSCVWYSTLMTVRFKDFIPPMHLLLSLPV